MSPCLPNEPRIIDPEIQGQLTRKYLSEYLTQIEQLFTDLRNQLDVHLRNAKPNKLGKTYPLGQCLEISQAFEAAFAHLEPSQLSSSEHVTAFQAIQAFLAAGGEFRQVWGDLRGEYFQNAFILGSWYVDVANDTVDVNKPSVEILPFSESGLRPIQNFAHFAVIAKRYWQAVCLPNIVFPELAHHFPMIVLQPNAGPQLQGLFDYMIALTRQSGFRLSEDAIVGLSFPDSLFQTFRRQGWAASGLAESADEAKQTAVDSCRRARERKMHEDSLIRDRVIQQALKVNRTWQDLRVEFHSKP
ncbi:hypothetical protein [Marinomonas ostreistagni]|uniref:Uncharacterized protein n=1 Tax=Marinomonas ostreistagni TaxID=359209 RepID=A0ABS0ZCX2_9GAMM|nr:hypothetical protein [Marinomonas ostreistagni]MBJ7551517.1 hypothetical protein [Marinomonas ostreistagni]